MKTRTMRDCLSRAVRLLPVLGLAFSSAGGQEESPVERGKYVFRASGGCSCHTDATKGGALLAGGRPIRTPFGTIYGTNITPDPETGIGTWSEEDFVTAMTEGKGPDGTVYYPVFPYPSFTRMTDRDLRDLKAYLDSVPPIKKPNQPPEFSFPYNIRTAVRVWRALYFDAGSYQSDPGRSEDWNRGAYLSTALAHCGECHTPRTSLGGPDQDRYYAGSLEGPEGESAPNITPDETTGIGSWSVADITWFLQTGFKPDGNDAQGLMREIIDEGYVHLRPSDLNAIAVYLKSLPPIVNRLEPR